MHEVSAHVVIVGAGHAGGSVAALLRQYGWKSPITLIGAESVPPYERPPLSKAWLTGHSDLASLLLRPAAFYAANTITLRLSSAATVIDRASRTLMIETGERIAYDHLILALGARPRVLPVPGSSLAGVYELRSVADADRLKAALRPGLRLAIIGAGYIG
ncbi:MAG TPA: FAD-dependent oxidoreductase, partial [Acetobacteraceae bacterium]|nr:FAD-dependent oxidoreductase [Acetobacteraceae bacterium]